MQKTIAQIGFWPTILTKLYRGSYQILSRLGFSMQGQCYPVYIRGIAHPVYCRFGTSDPWVLSQIFIDEEYSHLTGLEETKFILDCGGNVGYAAVYFLNHYPAAQVIVVEPDPGNLEICRKNLAAYGDRVQIVPSAIWSQATDLVLENPFDTAGEWAICVRPAQAGEQADLVATDIGSLMQQFGWSKIDILKVDIETAEAEVFAHNYRAWLDTVRHLAIEIHQVPGDRCQQVVMAALSQYDCEVWAAGELTFARFKKAPALVG